MTAKARKAWERSNLMVNYDRDVSEHPWFDEVYDLVSPTDWRIREAAASLALDGFACWELP